jgi:hypothetical protein
MSKSTKSLDIDKALALAIGWPHEQVAIHSGHVVVRSEEGWRVFDHSDWNVIGPIATRYTCFPNWFGTWYVSEPLMRVPVYGNTPQMAMAKAVIEIVRRRAADPIRARSKK